jgi:hypothetical protein
MDRFFLNLKIERVCQRRYADLAEIRRQINQQFVGLYNPVRLTRVWANCRPRLRGKTDRGATYLLV